MIDTQKISSTVGKIREAVSRTVVGQDEVIDQVLAAFLARGHVLLEGVPGTAKTMLVRVLARTIGIQFGRIQFTPDLMPSDVTGVNVYRETSRSFEFRPGPVFTDLLLADEINRAPAKTQSSLLEAMQERQITIDGNTHKMSNLFTVLATQNPVEFEGTYPLPEAQVDRFLIKVKVPYLSREAEIGMLSHHAEGFDDEKLDSSLSSASTSEECAGLREMCRTVKVAPEVREYIADIIRATRDDPALTLGASPRAGVALLKIARAAAIMAGRDFVIPDDAKGYALPVLRHRLLLAPELQVEGRSTDDVITSILLRIKAPQ